VAQGQRGPDAAAGIIVRLWCAFRVADVVWPRPTKQIQGTTTPDATITGSFIDVSIHSPRSRLCIAKYGAEMTMLNREEALKTIVDGFSWHAAQAKLRGTIHLFD
jgi:hypothetical protein